jgi:hypothetical protein
MNTKHAIGKEKMMIGMDKIANRNIVEKITEDFFFLSKSPNKLDKPLERMIKIKIENTQIINNRNEQEDVNRNLLVIKRIMRKYYI